MRPKASKKKSRKLGKQNSTGPLPPGVERRRRLRQEMQRETLTQFRRTGFFLLSGAALAWLLLTLGWSLRSKTQIQINASQRMDHNAITDAVVEAANLTFPQSLLALKPRQIETQLLQELPIQQASVQRRLLPPGLDIQIVERQPIAAATRIGPKGIEQGMVDSKGQWMSTSMMKESVKPATAVKVEGWISRRKEIIAEILQRSASLNRPLKAILIEPAGGINLRVETLGLVSLGTNDKLLDQQFKIIEKLNKSLPSDLRGPSNAGLDLSDPNQPELQLRPSIKPNIPDKDS